LLRGEVSSYIGLLSSSILRVLRGLGGLKLLVGLLLLLRRRLTSRRGGRGRDKKLVSSFIDLFKGESSLRNQ